MMSYAASRSDRRTWARPLQPSFSRHCAPRPPVNNPEPYATVHDVSRACAAGPDRAGHQRRHVSMSRAVYPTTVGFARRAARGVVPRRTLRHRKRARTDAIALGQVNRLAEESNLRERAQFVRMGSDRDAFLLVRWDVVVGVANRPLESLQLKAFEFVPARPLNRFEASRPLSSFRHYESRPRDARSARCSAIRQVLG